MDRVLTFGIAGHVDHGKTTLVRALTGIETDRLPEEQRRGISIELGFAWVDLVLSDGSGLRAGIVDMPGHERFVRRMISGAAGIDAVLLVVAADEGVMPQGREHLAICDLLGVQTGAVIVTKVDLADELLGELVIEDVADLARGTFLDGSPVLRFSSRDPERWIPDLRAGLAGLAEKVLQQRDEGLGPRADRPFRMSVDRHFTMKGRGTVVTGTAASGAVARDEVMQVYPGTAQFRVRDIQRHSESVERFEAPGRLALNLASASLDDAPVGAVLAPPQTLFATERFDARLRLLGHADRGFAPRQRALVHIGTTHAQCAITQLDGERLEPNGTGLVQVHLDEPLAVAPGEHFVVRGSQVDARHGQTLAGGTVLHPTPARHRLGDPAVLEALMEVGGRDVEGRLLALVQLAGIRGETEGGLVRLDRASPLLINRAVKQALARGRLRRFGPAPRLYTPEAVAELEARALALVRRSHELHPERDGIEGDELARRVGSWLDAGAIAAVVAGLVKRNSLEARGQALALPEFAPERAAARPEVVAALVGRLREIGLAAPRPQDLMDELGVARLDRAELELALRAAVAAGDLEKVSAEYYLPRALLHQTVGQILAHFGPAGGYSTGDLKSFLGLTRKHLIPLAELLDNRRITVRNPEGDRRLRSAALAAWKEGRNPLG